MLSWRDDFRLAARQLRKSPGWTAIAALALAVGIGFNTATFSTADVLLFRPLILPEIDRAIAVVGRESGHARDRLLSGYDFIRFQEQSKTLTSLAAAGFGEFSLSIHGEPEKVFGYRVSSNFLKAMNIQPLYGRGFTAEESTPGQGTVVLLSHALWDRMFGRDPAAVGREIQLDGRAHRIAGVMPDHFRFPAAAELWAPLEISQELRQQHGVFRYEVYGRLAEGKQIGEAEAELKALAAAIAAEQPLTHRNLSVAVRSLAHIASGDYTREYTSMMLYGVGFLLLIACANVANLQLARTAGRARELAVRAAIGAGRWRIVRMVFAESLLLSVIGALGGVLLAYWLVDLIRSYMPAEVERFVPGWRRMSVNAVVLMATAAVTLVAAVLSSLAPVFFVLRADVNAGLRDGSRGSTGGKKRLRSALVVVQTAVSVVLLVGAVLMVKGFRAVSELRPERDAGRVLTFRVALPETRYATSEQIARFQSELLTKLQTAPGVAEAAMASSVPYAQRRSLSLFQIEGQIRSEDPDPVAITQSVSAQFLTAMRIPMLRGRAITESDGAEAPRVVVISETLAKRYFGNTDPIGKRIRLGHKKADLPWMTVVGVAGDVLYEWTERALPAVLYRPYRQAPVRAADFVLRAAAGGAASLVSAARVAVRAVDPQQPMSDIAPYPKVVSDSLTGLAYVAWMMGTLGVVALFLAAIGVYSVMAHIAFERTREMGVRLALGATPASLFGLILQKGFLLTGIGLAIGLAGAAVLAWMVSGLIFGVSTHDPLAFGGVTFALAFAAFLACYLPAQRAMKGGPLPALRSE